MNKMANTNNLSTNPTWDTIHIFGYGETQLNGSGLSKKFTTTDLSKVQDVIDNILSLKPTDLQLTDFHCINIFKDAKMVFMSKETTEFNFTIDYAELDPLKIEALTQEILNK